MPDPIPAETQAARLDFKSGHYPIQAANWQPKI